MIRAQKEIIWHLTCTSCKYYWSFPTMNENYKIEVGQIYCPGCGMKCCVEIDKQI